THPAARRQTGAARLCADAAAGQVADLDAGEVGQPPFPNAPPMAFARRRRGVHWTLDAIAPPALRSIALEEDMRRLIFVLSCLVAFNLPFPTQAAELIGVWAVASGNARVQIQRCAPPGGDAFCGYIVWLKQAANPDGTPVAS